MDSTKHDMLADTIGVKSEVDARRRFWLAHMRIGFGIFLLETVVVMLYLHLTPAEPHRTLLWPHCRTEGGRAGVADQVLRHLDGGVNFRGRSGGAARHRCQ
jgi:hypothetical protein